MKPVRTILTAGLMAGAFDIVDAFVFFMHGSSSRTVGSASSPLREIAQ